MRNVFLFIARYHVFFLFLLLQIVCFYLIVSYNRFHRASFFNSSNAVAGTLYTWRSNFTGYFSLQQQNEELAQENAELRNRLPGSFEVVNEQYVMYNDTLKELKYQYITARVVNNSINRQMNYLTLNKGRREKIEPEMGVVGPNGIVGVVKDVSEHFCTVISVLNTDFTVGIKLEENNNFGLLRWDGEDYRYARMADIAKHVVVEPGMRVVTRGNSTIFPKDIPVGVVHTVTDEPGSNYLDIELQLATDFNTLENVYIVNNLFKEEQETLEATNEENAE